MRIIKQSCESCGYRGLIIPIEQDELEYEYCPQCGACPEWEEDDQESICLDWLEEAEFPHV